MLARFGRCLGTLTPRSRAVGVLGSVCMEVGMPIAGFGGLQQQRGIGSSCCTPSSLPPP